MSPRKSFLILSLFLILSAAALPTYAYEEDTHFLMTYVICRSVGFTDKEALIVASVDQGMDDSRDTNAKTKMQTPQALEQWLWHAIDKDGEMKVAGILARRDALFYDALNEPDPRNRLIRIGIFFHFQQATWAHRDHDKDNHESADNYTPVKTPEGHAPWGAQPDRPPYDPVVALKCLEDGIVYARTFLEHSMHRTPNAFFASYKPAGGTIDSTWKDKREGQRFHQISITGLAPNSPQLFLASLIRSQIEAYGADKTNVRYFNQNTANEADLIKVGTALGLVCDAFKSSVGVIRLPLVTDKPPEFQKLTTVGLLSLRPGSL